MRHRHDLPRDANVDAIMPMLDRVTAEIIAMDIPMNARMGVAVIAATHFIGAAAALLAKIAKEKGGPELDAAGWSEPVMKMITDLLKAERH